MTEGLCAAFDTAAAPEQRAQRVFWRAVAELAATAAAIYVIGKSDEAFSQPIAELAHQYPTITILTNGVVKAFTGKIVIEGLIIEQAGQTRVLPVERVVVDLGLVPNSEMIRGLGCTDTDGFVCRPSGGLRHR